MILCRLFALQPLPLNNFVLDDAGHGQSHVWALDPVSLSRTDRHLKAGTNAGVLRPVYILQPDAVPTGGRGHKKYDRGRSFSPPKHHRNQNGAHTARGHYPTFHQNHTRDESVGTGGNFAHKDTFRKSFSSDQLYFDTDKQTRTHDPPYSFSLSSNSSSTSTGSSRGGHWHKDFRSSIPVPITSDKFKLRTGNSNNSNFTGPVIARRNVINSPQQTPISTKLSNRDNDSVSQLSLPPPRSSGSESSGYFTPPPEVQPAFVKMDTEERVSSDAEATNNNSQDCARSNNSRSASSTKTLPENDQRTLSPSSVDAVDNPGGDINDNYPSVESLNQTLTNDPTDRPETRLSRYGTPVASTLVFSESSSAPIEVRRKSKSVIDLQNFLPEINTIRKTANSAPPRNEELSVVVTNNGESLVESPSSPPAVIPLNSMDRFDQSPPSLPNGSTSSRLEKRFTRNNNRKSLKASPKVPNDSIQCRPFSKPKEGLQQALAQMESPEWEVTIKGLQTLTRIARHNPEVIEQHMHTTCAVLAKQIRNLRSQVARSACHAATELFLMCKRGLDMELDEIAGPLLQRTADTNKFLRADANSALDVMCEHLPVSRVVPVLTGRGCSHQNALVRAASIRLLTNTVKKFGPEKTLQLSKELRDKVLLAAANSLADGNLETRHHGKALLGSVIGCPGFQRALHEAVPQNVLRHIAKTLASIK